VVSTYAPVSGVWGGGRVPLNAVNGRVLVTTG
jgi:hypothetical protein